MDTLNPLYVLHPGMVRSESDGDMHYIGVHQLCGLYRVDARDCVTYHSEETVYKTPRPLVHLYPRSDGDYALPEPPTA